MNRFQRVWWVQAKSDHEMFVVCRSNGLPRCHSLHFLQMATEKLAKAYFWRSGNPPPKSHSGFVKYLRFLGATVPGNRDRVSELFSYKRFEDFQQWLRYTLPIAYDLERLTPDLSNDGPNPEYPWPHSLPETAPVEHGFQVWDKLVAAQGRGLLRMVETAINCFPLYADL